MKPRCLFQCGTALLLVAFASPVFSADCNDQVISGSPSSDDIAAYYTNALNGGTICGGGFSPNNSFTNIFNANEIFFNVTRSTATGPLDLCLGAFQDIISQCVQSENKWGGWWSLNGQFYSITNNIFPADGTGLTATTTTDQPSTTTTMPAAGEFTSTIVVSDGDGGGITIPPQTATESGTFTTSFVSGVTANTITTTSLSDSSGQTILPIWFCPSCVAAAAGILVIPLVAPAAGGLIPPPPGFPALAIGPDGLPTATGDPAPGSQPTGDPRTATDSAIMPSETSINVPNPTGDCQYWKIGSAKREVEVRQVVKIIQTWDTILSRALIKRDEIEANVPQPLRAAIQAIGGFDSISSATNLEIITSKFPKVVMENRFITGLQGRVSRPINIDYNLGSQTVRIQMKAGDLFRIRWDFDPTKGSHVNAEFFGSSSAGTAKIAFTPTSTPLVDPPDNRNPSLFQDIVSDQSNSLEYQTKPNSDSQVFSPAERTGGSPANQQAQLQALPQKLIQLWQNKYEDC